ncbi:MAG: glycosyltransferase family 2 protein, partial [Proteobacteria bacterium]|nr:glycosyltransferase family 2 protein [Pseudomonadota bacterium]
LAAVVAQYPGAVLLPQATNLGLAAAFNAGIAWARAHGFHHVLLLDQDSRPADAMVRELLQALAALSAREKIAAVGPRYRDEQESRDAPFVRIRFPFNRKLYCGDGCPETVRCDFLISSGSLIPLDVLDDVGGMDDALFIDNVDLEWCFRARAAGYSLYGACAARMAHRLGDARRRLPGLPRGVIVHAPRRLFFIMRNRLLLYRRAATPGAWIAQDVPRVFVKFLLFSVFIGPRRRHLRAMLAGLHAGMRGSTEMPENAPWR